MLKRMPRAMQWALFPLIAVVVLSGCRDKARVCERLRTVAGMEPDAVRKCLTDLQDTVRHRDAERFARYVDLPQTVLIQGQRTIVETEEQFAQNFAEIINERVRRVVMAQRFDDLFVNWRGCMLGSGEIWLGQGGRIQRINNAPENVRWAELPLRYLEPCGREIIAPLCHRDAQKAVAQIRLVVAEAEVQLLPDAATGGGVVVYKADVNNDGLPEVVVTAHGQGSGGYSSVEGVFQLAPQGVTRLPFNDIVVRALFPRKDMSRFHMSLAEPFLIRKDDTVYMGFADGVKPTYYRWKPGGRFQPLKAGELRLEGR